MSLEYNKMSLHADLTELADKYEDTLPVQSTGHTMVQYGTEYMLDNMSKSGVAIWTANQAIADAIKHFNNGV